MEHVVFYPAASGVPAFRRVSSLDEAVAFVEHLRNAENVTDFSVHELSLVQLSLRPYYHVEVPAGTTDDAPKAEASAEPAEPVEAAPAAQADEDTEPEAEVAEAPAVADAAEAPIAVAAEPEPAALSLVPDEPVAADEPSDEVTPVPVEADDDRSAEWVAEATVVEPPAPEVEAESAEPETASAEAEIPAVPGLVDEEPVVAVVPPFADPVAETDAAEGDSEPAAERAVAEAPAQRTPFADAPPVTAPVAEAPAEDSEPVTDSADIIPALAPSGRRSLGFFAR